MSWDERYKQRMLGVDSLNKRIKKYAPKAVIAVMLDIEYDVKEAVEKAGEVIQYFESLPFPVFNHQKRFEEELAEILHKYHSDDIFYPPIIKP